MKAVAGCVPVLRRELSADRLVKLLRQRFEQVPDPRRSGSVGYWLADCLMAGFAMFSLKDPSLLAFQKRADDDNLRTLYWIERIPSDSTFREALDPLELEPLNAAFADIFRQVQRGGLLRQYRWTAEGGYLLAIDGTGYFCSSKVRCQHCLEQRTSGGQTQYAHQLVAAVLVHPQRKEVLPLAIEPIVRQDGQTKNDCERNATRRLLERVRRQHPQLKLTVVEDGLSSNAPHIRDLQRLGISYILGAKPGDHQHLYDQVIAAGDSGHLHHHQRCLGGRTAGVTAHTQWARELELNASNPDLKVNYFEYHQFAADGEVARRFSFVTDHAVSASSVERLLSAGRSRWRIENETFNTLKNQGYHFEHNYGHGCQQLSSVLALLMMLAFLVDQVQQACCPLFQAALAAAGSRRQLWDELRSHVRHFLFASFRSLYEAMLDGRCKNQLIPLPGCGP